MIELVRGKNFKGRDFEQKLSQHNLFVGPNGSGKSSVSQALQLTIAGQIVGYDKTGNQSIHAAFASADKMTVGVAIDGKSFSRTYSLQKSGSVTVNHACGGTRAKAETYSTELGKAGAPVVVDVAAFLSLSDAKKLEALRTRFPMGEDLDELSSDIDAIDRKIKTQQADIRANENAIRQLRSSRPDLPAGSLSEISGEIEIVEAQLQDAQAGLQAIEKREAEEAAATRAVEEERRKQTREEMQRGVPSEAPTATHAAMQDKDIPPDVVDRQGARAAVNRLKSRMDHVVHPDPAQSILAIISAMEKTGCSVCAAKMVAKRELNRYRTERTGTHG